MKSIQFFKEITTGDYLCINPDLLENGCFEGRSVAIVNDFSSVCTTSISKQFIDEDCEAVHLMDVPEEWLNAFGLESEICAECGKSVKWGSGRYANRVPECNDIKTRAQMGRLYPEGEWICADCDAKNSDD